MIRKSLACLPLAVGGAALTASAVSGAAPVTVPLIVGALLTGGASHVFNKLLDQSGDKLSGVFAARYLTIDENHHILIALRTAHINALEAILYRFDEARVEDRDPRRTEDANRFSSEIRDFLKKAKSTTVTGQGPVTVLERSVFENLSSSFEAALAAQGATAPETAQQALRDVRRQIEEDVLMELVSETASDGTDIPSLFRIAFVGDGTNGWLDLFVRAAAAQLKSNSAFQSIWSAEQLAQLQQRSRDLHAGMVTIAEDLVTLANEESRRHAESMAMQEEILQAIAREKGVAPEHLKPTLDRLGHTNVPIADIPKLLAASVDDLLARSLDLAPIHNDGAAIDDAIRSARKRLQNADVEGAISVLEEALNADDAYARALKAEEEARIHRQQMGLGRARAMFEKAFIQSTAYDYVEAIASLKQGLQLDQDNISQWIRLGEVFTTIGNTDEALKAFMSAAEAAIRTGGPRDLLVSYNKVGDVLVAQGERKAALKSYQDGLAIAERLAARDPGNADWQRDLIVSYVKISEICAAEALQLLSKALFVAEQLKRQDQLAPTDEWMLQDLAERLKEL